MQELQVIDHLHVFTKNDRKGEITLHAQTFNEYLVYAVNSQCHIHNTDTGEHFIIRMDLDDWYVTVPFFDAAKEKENG